MRTKAQRVQAQVQLAKAMTHPLRVEIWTIINERVASPNEIAAELGENLTDVAYHMRKLQKLGCAELVDTRPVRGAVEHFYRASRRSLISTEDWDEVPETEKAPLGDRFMQAILDDYAVARKADTATRDKHFHIGRTPMVVDAAGRDRILELLEEARLAALEEQKASLLRIGESGEDAINLSFGIATFQMPAGD
jgi:Helix-turn-helix domain